MPHEPKPFSGEDARLLLAVAALRIHVAGFDERTIADWLQALASDFRASNIRGEFSEEQLLSAVARYTASDERSFEARGVLQ